MAMDADFRDREPATPMRKAFSLRLGCESFSLPEVHDYWGASGKVNGGPALAPKR